MPISLGFLQHYSNTLSIVDTVRQEIEPITAPSGAHDLKIYGTTCCGGPFSPTGIDPKGNFANSSISNSIRP